MRRFPKLLPALAASLLLAVLAGCARLAPPDLSTPVATLSRGQISFSSVRFLAVNNADYTTLFPVASAVAKGLGSDEYTATLDADWALVLRCTNNGTNVPNGAINYPLLSNLATATFFNTSRNGTQDVTLDIGTTTEPTRLEEFWARLQAGAVEGADPVEAADVCPNPNYTVDVLGARYNTITIGLDDSSGTQVDSITYTCSNPGDPTTCSLVSTKGAGKK